MYRFRKSLLLTLTAVLLLSAWNSGCKKEDDHDHDDEQELITTVRVTFTGGGATTSFNWKDVDGAGGKAPVIDKIVLKENILYTVTVSFLNESVSPAEDITTEVKTEGTAHLVCFGSTGNISSPLATDTDSNGKPLGLNASCTTLAAGDGTLTISLKHEPNKSGASPCTTGETDAEASFAVTIQ